jgi:hypothetical protein
MPVGPTLVGRQGRLDNVSPFDDELDERHKPPVPHLDGGQGQGPDSVNVPEADIRHDLVARIRSEIEAGTYDTPEKLSIALERMIDDVNE